MTSILVIIFCFYSCLVKADMPRCDRHSPDFSKSPYCLPFDYNLDIIPPTEGPLNVNVDIFVFEVSKIDDISLSMTFELYFDLTWNESRLLINESAPEWETDGSVMGSTNYVKSLWLPDIQIYNIKQFQTRAIVTDVAGLIIFKNKNILYTVSTEAVISCPMKFSAYPLDHQECSFRVGSYIHDASQIRFSGTFGHDTVNQRAQQYQISIKGLEEADRTIVWANRNYSQTGFKINLIRRRTPVLLQTYLPSGLFVVVSWISFIVPPEIVPGRMALLVTLFLVLVNIFNSVTANAPKSEGLTAVETWVVTCIIHVFCVLLEYAFILKIIQVEKRKSTARLRKVDRANNAISASNMSLNNKSLISFAAAAALSSNGENEYIPPPNQTQPVTTLADRLARCFSSQTSSSSNNCCHSPKSEECYENGSDKNQEAMAMAATASVNASTSTAERISLHRNCGCDDHHNMTHRRKFASRSSVPKMASSPTQTEQVLEASVEQQPFSHSRGSTARHMAPHHPLLAGLEPYDNHGRRVHQRNPTCSYHNRYSGGMGNTFGGSGPDMPSAPALPETDSSQLQWTKIDFGAAMTGSKSAPVTSGNSPTQSLSVRSPLTDQMRLNAKYEKIDSIATALFPIIFFLFNVCYWSYYLLLSDALSDLWNCGGIGECERMKKQCDSYAYACDE